MRKTIPYIMAKITLMILRFGHSPEAEELFSLHSPRAKMKSAYGAIAV
jgi:hypothetical protein